MRQHKIVKRVCVGREEGLLHCQGILHCRGVTEPADETEMRAVRRKEHQASVVFWVSSEQVTAHLETLLLRGLSSWIHSKKGRFKRIWGKNE